MTSSLVNWRQPSFLSFFDFRSNWYVAAAAVTTTTIIKWQQQQCTLYKYIVYCTLLKVCGRYCCLGRHPHSLDSGRNQEHEDKIHTGGGLTIKCCKNNSFPKGCGRYCCLGGAPEKKPGAWRPWHNGAVARDRDVTTIRVFEDISIF